MNNKNTKDSFLEKVTFSKNEKIEVNITNNFNFNPAE